MIFLHRRTTLVLHRCWQWSAGLFLATASVAALDSQRLPEQYGYARWNETQDGLPGGAVQALFQTRNGSVWVGTRGGLASFDGVKFTSYSATNELVLGEAGVLALGEDASGRLWVGTQRGVACFDGAAWSRPVQGGGRDAERIAAIFGDSDGSVYLAGAAGLVRYKNGRATPLVFAEAEPPGRVNVFCREPGGGLYAGGKHLYQISGDRVTKVAGAEAIGTLEITALEAAPKGGLWIGTTQGLKYFQDGRWQSVPQQEGLGTETINFLKLDHDGSLWIGTARGLLRLADGRVQVLPDSDGDPANSVLCLMEDPEGGLWGGVDNGLFRLHDVKAVNLTKQLDLPVKAVASLLAASDGSQWIGTLGGGLVHCSGGQPRIYRAADGLLEDSVLCLSESSTGGVWLGYAGAGLSRLEKDGVTHFREAQGIDARVLAVAIDAQRGVWVVSETAGLMRWEGDKFQHVPVDGVAKVRVLRLAPTGELWLAGDGGAACLRDGRWTHFPLPEGTPDATARDIIFATNGGTWVIRDGGELQRIRAGWTERFHLSASVGPRTFGGVELNGELWVGFTNGVARISAEEIERVSSGAKASPAFALYDETDGFCGRASCIASSNVAKLASGVLWVGTNKGVAEIDPARIRPNEVSPVPIIQRVWVEGVEYPPSQVKSESVGQGGLAFVFTAPSFVNSSKVQFRYRLEGVDSDWVDSRGQRKAVYHGVKSGAYRFQVKACNSEGVWSREPAICVVTLVPRFYQTPWFWLVSGGSLLLSLVAVGLVWTSRLRASERRLRLLVEERTRDLKKAKTEAAAASRAQSEFVANISHGIRTPMNGVLGMNELALNLASDPEQRSYLKTTQASGEAVMSVMNDVLDYARIESGLLILEPEDFDLHDCVEGAVETMAVKAVLKNLELVCDIDPAVPALVTGDAARLRQVLLNLLGNAIKFTESGEVVLRVSVVVREKDRCELNFAIADTGAGQASGQKQTFFGSSGEDGVSGHWFGGNGVGLTLCRKLVELMGGRIWMESEAGRGSCCYFTAMLACRPEPPANGVPTSSGLEELSVLIIDDNLVNRLILEEMSRHWKMRPTAVYGGSAAVLAVTNRQARGESPFDLIISDVQMPQMDGFETIRALRMLPAYLDVPVVMLSSGDPHEDARRCREVGVQLYLKKPVLRPRLHERLLKLLHKTPSASHDAGAHEGMPPKMKRIRVLLAEDNVMNQVVARKMLERAGHSVECAVDGAQAVAWYKDKHYDLILMDLDMPQLDGCEATVCIRQLEKAKGGHICIVALTAHAMKGDRDRCLQAGMDHYLSKPVRSYELYSLLQQIFPVEGHDLHGPAESKYRS